MEYVTEIGENGEITLPSEICEALGWEAGDTLVFLQVKQEIRVVKFDERENELRYIEANDDEREIIDRAAGILEKTRAEAAFWYRHVPLNSYGMKSAEQWYLESCGDDMAIHKHLDDLEAESKK